MLLTLLREVASVLKRWSLDKYFVQLKGAESRNLEENCYLYSLHCGSHVAIVFCTDFDGWCKLTVKMAASKTLSISLSLQSYNMSV